MGEREREREREGRRELGYQILIMLDSLVDETPPSHP